MQKTSQTVILSLIFWLPPAPFFFDLHVLSVFSLWISGSVFLCSLFIYRYFLYFLSLFLLSVSLVKGKLDPESLGIILLGPFLLEFFPDQVCVCARVCVCVCVCVRRGELLPQTNTCTQCDKCLPTVKTHGQNSHIHTHMLSG